MDSLFRRSGRSRTLSRVIPIVVLAALLISMLPAFVPPAAVAQDGDMTTPVAEVQDTGDAPPVETVESDVPVEPEDVPDESTEGTGPTETPQTQSDAPAGGVAAHIAEARSCPPGFDPSAGDAATALGACSTPLAGISFTLAAQHPNYSGDTRTSGGDGVAAWTDIPLGASYSVSATASQSAGDPWVYCELTGGPGSDQYLFFPAGGGYMDIGLSDPGQAGYAQTFCRWFVSVPADAALVATPDASQALGTGEVHLTNYLCPVNYNTINLTLAALQTACMTPGESIQFALQSGQGAERTGATDAQGRLSWTGVPAGDLKIIESVPKGFRGATPFCSFTPLGSDPGPLQSMLSKSDGSTTTVSLPEGQALHCSLFNLAEPQSTIAVIPFLCPSDYTTSTLTLGDLTASCSTAGTNIDYVLTTSSGFTQSGNTGSNGFVEFTGVPAGAVSIEETVPAGFLLGTAYCKASPPQGELGGGTWERTVVEHDVISATVPDRFTLNCYVFHIWPIVYGPAGPGGATVNLTSYVCPPWLTFGDLTSVSNDGTKCYGAAGWKYGYEGEGFSQELMTDPVGSTKGTQTPAGPFTLTGPQQEGFRPDALWCSSNGGAYEKMLGRDEQVLSYTPAADEVLNCQWFNVQVYPAGTKVVVWIEAHLCEANTPTTVVLEDWQQACPALHPDETFEILDSEGDPATGTTGSDGLVTLTVNPGGDIYIGEGQPDAYPGGWAWCGTVDRDGKLAYVNGGHLTPGESSVSLTNVRPDYLYFCWWFDAPLDSKVMEASGSGQVVVYSWRCPEGYDAAGATIEQLYRDCPTPQPGIQIGVSYDSGDSFTQPTRLIKGPAMAFFKDLPPGMVGIGETPPSGQKLARAFCKTGAADVSSLAITDGLVEYSVGTGGIAATIENGKYIECFFFNVSTGDQGDPPSSGMVYVDKRNCTPGFGAIAASYVDIAMQCAPEAGVEFKLTQGESTLSAVTGESGLTTFPKVSSGAVRITELPREGYDTPKVFCRATAEGAGATGELTPVTVTAWGIDYDLREGDYLECVWANMPAASASSEPGLVLLHVFSCSEGTGEYLSRYELSARCDGRPEGVKLTAGAPLAAPSEGITNSMGDVLFKGLAPGFVKVEQVAGQGSHAIAAWCSYYPSATGSIRDTARHGAQPLYAYVASGYALECYWYMVPYVEPVNVTVLERVCPADYGTVGASREDLVFNCTTSPTGVEFQLQDEANTIPYELIQTTDADGRVDFLGIPVTPVLISERSPEYQAVAVFCGQAPFGSSNPPTSYTELPVDQETVRYEIQPAGDVLCYWIAIEAPPATVTVTKFACPEGYQPNGAPYDDLRAKCPESLKEVTFTLGGPATEISKVTDATGVVLWEGVAPGPVFISETPVKGYSSAVVFCAVAPRGALLGAFEPVPVEQLSIEREVAGGDGLECVWFNLTKSGHPTQPSPTPTQTATPTKTPSTPPASPTPVTGKPGTPTPVSTVDPNAPATLVLTAFTCPVDYELYDPEADLTEDCDEAAEGIEFAIDALDHQAAPAKAEVSTDEDGVATFSGLKAGPWLLTETLPEETRTAFISSCASDQRDVEAEELFMPLTYIGPDGQIGVTLIAGETLTCEVYGIPEEAEAA